MIDRLPTDITYRNLKKKGLRHLIVNIRPNEHIELPCGTLIFCSGFKKTDAVIHVSTQQKVVIRSTDLVNLKTEDLLETTAPKSTDARRRVVVSTSNQQKKGNIR